MGRIYNSPTYYLSQHLNILPFDEVVAEYVKDNYPLGVLGRQYCILFEGRLIESDGKASVFQDVGALADSIRRSNTRTTVILGDRSDVERLRKVANNRVVRNEEIADKKTFVSWTVR